MPQTPLWGLYAISPPTFKAAAQVTSSSAGHAQAEKPSGQRGLSSLDPELGSTVAVVTQGEGSV